MNLTPILPFLGAVKPGVWRRFLDSFGEEEAYRMALLGRDKAIEAVRLDHNWTLEDIGVLFDLTRERIRQLTPPEIWAHRERACPDLAPALRAVVMQPGLWKREGHLPLDWISAQASYPVTREDCLAQMAPGLSLRENDRGLKFYVILQFGLGLKTKEEMLDWIHEQYWTHRRSYADIAVVLSERFVKVTTMAVYRGCRSLGFKGRPAGRYEREYYLPDN